MKQILAGGRLDRISLSVVKSLIQISKDFNSNVQHEKDTLNRIKNNKVTEPWWLSGLMCQSIINECSRLRVQQVRAHPF